MNHKLHNTILASAVVGAALLFGLLAAGPVGSDRYAAGHQDTFHGGAARSALAADLRNDIVRDFERRARHLETDLSGAGSASEALAMASTLFATSVMEATLATVLDDVAQRQQPPPRPTAAYDDAQAERQARSRSAMAMPYFSTARGARRGYRE